MPLSSKDYDKIDFFGDKSREEIFAKIDDWAKKGFKITGILTENGQWIAFFLKKAPWRELLKNWRWKFKAITTEEIPVYHFNFERFLSGQKAEGA